MLKNYFKTAWRNLWKHKLVSFINIGGLAVGMAAAVFIFMWVQNELHFDDYHNRPGDIYRIKCYLTLDKKTTWIWENSSYRMGLAAEKDVPGVERVARIRPLNYGPIYIKQKEQFIPEEHAAVVDSNWFDVFSYHFVSGGASAFNSEPFSLIITESKARKYFGNTGAVGQTLHIDSVDYKVQGVIKDNPANTNFNYDIFMPVASRHANPKEKNNELNWGNFYYLTFLRLNHAASPKKIAAQLNKITNKARATDNLKLELTPLADIHFEDGLQSSSLVHGNHKMVYIFSVLGFFLLLIACINYVNITTARASLRAKEVSIKKIVGAGRATLFWQFIAETALVSCLALLLTLLIISLGLSWFNGFTQRHFTLQWDNLYVWGVIASTLVFSVLLNSIYPAILLSSFKPLNAFRKVSVLKMSDASLRKALVVLQFGFSIFLIIGVITIYRQMAFIQNQDPGYKRNQVMMFHLPFEFFDSKNTPEFRQNTVAAIKNSLQQESAVAGVSVVNMNTIQDFDNQSSGNIDWPGRPEDFKPAAAFFQLDPDYIKVVKLNMLQGKWFNANTPADKKNVVLNETAVKEFGLAKPVVGSTFIAQGDTGRVIGVVKDFAFRNAHDKIGAAVMRWNDDYSIGFLVNVKAGKQAAAIQLASKLWKEHCPNNPFVYTFLDQEFENIYRADAKQSALITIFASLAIIISCLGLFGLAAFTAERKSKEISIRKVLGATMGNIVQMLSADFIALVFVALLVAGPLAWWLMNKWLQDFAYRINMQWWMPVVAGIIAAAITLCTVGAQAVKAALSNPVKNLRND